jgi:amphi-Trp domain-containing protein
MSDDLKNFKYESVQDMETIVSYLEALAEGFRSGELLFASQDKEMIYRPTGLVGLTVESKKKGARRKLSIKLGWKETDEDESKNTPPLVIKALRKDQ